MGRYDRKFDWDRAIRLHDEGIPIDWIAKSEGVTPEAVRRIVIPGENDKMRARHRAYQASGKCPICGGKMNRITQNRGSVCIECARKRRTINVRDTTLKCVTCKQWFPDDHFYSSSPNKHRRGRSGSCKTCSNAARKHYRETHREQERQYQRQRYKKKKQKEAAQLPPQQERWDALLRAVENERRENGDRDGTRDDRDRTASGTDPARRTG